MSAGVEIVSVTKGAPGSKAGLNGATDTKTIDGTPFSTGGDVITKIDGTAVHTADQVVALIGTKKPGEQIQLTVVRNGATSRSRSRSAATSCADEAGRPRPGGGPPRQPRA